MITPCASTLVMPPGDGPLTLAEAKLRAGLDWADGDPRDALMRGFIRTARAKVEKDTGVALVEQVHEWRFSSLSNGVIVELPLRPVIEVEVTYQDTGQLTHALDPASVALAQWGAVPVSARLRLGMTTGWPSDLAPRLPWSVRASVGFATVEALAQAAPELLHAVGLLTAHYATFGRDLTTVGTIVALTPFGYDDLIAPYRLVSL